MDFHRFYVFAAVAFQLSMGWLEFRAWSYQPALPLRTTGRFIVDQQGKRFKLKSVNWYGASDVHEVVGGLDKQSMGNIVQLIRTLGFNSVRLPFSNQMLRRTAPVDPKFLAANPDLWGKTPLEIYDAVIRALTQAGIAVILNNHTTFSKWCCGYDDNGLWYYQTLDSNLRQTQKQWIQDWVTLVSRYRENPWVIGADLRNEVRTARIGSTWLPITPTWGSGSENDWRLAAREASDQIQAVNPNLLMIVEAVNWEGMLPSMGGHRPFLKPVIDHPLSLKLPHHLVYSVHNYAFIGPENTGDGRTSRGRIAYSDMDQQSLFRKLDEEWLTNQDGITPYTAPLWVSEFGVSSKDSGPKEKDWFENLVSYLIQHDLDFAYWPLNPEKSDGPDSFGLLTQDWGAILNDWRTPLLKKLLNTEQNEWPPKIPSYQVADYDNGNDNQSISLKAWTKKTAATCSDGLRVVGVSRHSFGSGSFKVLCTDAGFDSLWSPNREVISVQNEVPSSRGYDWAKGHIKYECPINYYIAGVSRSEWGTNGILCAKANRDLGSKCETLNIERSDARLSAEGDDWAKGAYKGQCQDEQYLAGISEKWGAVTSLLCCLLN